MKAYQELYLIFENAGETAKQIKKEMEKPKKNYEI